MINILMPLLCSQCLLCIICMLHITTGNSPYHCINCTSLFNALSNYSKSCIPDLSHIAYLFFKFFGNF